MCSLAESCPLNQNFVYLNETQGKEEFVLGKYKVEKKGGQTVK